MLEVNSNSLERKSRIQSALVTLVIQLLLFLAFYFMVVWEQPNPPIPTYGLELNLGFSDFGSGDPSEVLPNSSEIPVTEAPAPGEIVSATQTTVATSNAAASTTKPTTNRAVSTQISPIKGETTANETPLKEEKKEASSSQKTNEPQKVDQRALFGAGGKAGNGSNPTTASGQGNSNGSGDQGKPTGTVDGRALQGSGSGTGKVVQALPLEYNVSNEVLAYYRQVVNQLDFKKSGGSAAEFSKGKITFVIKVE